MIKSPSLFRETWQAMISSVATMAPWVVVFAVVMGVGSFLLGDMEAYRAYPELLWAHPEVVRRGFGGGLGLLLAESVGFYLFSLVYLRQTMPWQAPDISLRGYLHWLKMTVWKYLRPALWLLIPVIGWGFYLRSLIRYELVSPLAVLRRGPELRRSWDMTEGHWWRIFGNALLLGIVLALVMGALALIPALTLAITAFGDFQSPVFRGGMAFLQGLWQAVSMMSLAIYSCVTYRVLLQERNQAKLPPVVSNNPFTPA